MLDYVLECCGDKTVVEIEAEVAASSRADLVDDPRELAAYLKLMADEKAAAGNPGPAPY